MALSYPLTTTTITVWQVAKTSIRFHLREMESYLPPLLPCISSIVCSLANTILKNSRKAKDNSGKQQTRNKKQLKGVFNYQINYSQCRPCLCNFDIFRWCLRNRINGGGDAMILREKELLGKVFEYLKVI